MAAEAHFPVAVHIFPRDWTQQVVAVGVRFVLSLDFA
jgi:hypothetical protein